MKIYTTANRIDIEGVREWEKRGRNRSRPHRKRASFYKWRQRYWGIEASELKRLKELEEVNRKLKMMYAEQALDIKLAREIIEKKF